MGKEPKFIDNLVMDTRPIIKYIDGVLKKLNYKNTSNDVGSYTSWCKNGKNCIYGIDCISANGVVNLYIRCLEDSEDNKAILAGGKDFVK